MIKNGSNAGRESITVPFSNVKLSILDCLIKEGYVKSAIKKAKKGLEYIEVGLAYNDGKPKVTGAGRVSKLSCRVYMGVKDIRSNRSGYGLTIMTTPKGIMTDKQARKEMVGGEVLFKIW